jgi:hypothetical protein
MTETFNAKPGQRVYTADGRMGDFLVKLDSGNSILRPVFEVNGYDGATDEYADGLIEVGTIYAQPPRAKLDDMIAGLDAKVSQLRDDIRGLEAEKWAFGQDHAERAARIAKHDQLATLDHFLSGAITHVVMKSGYGSGLKIVPFADALNVPEDDRYSRRESEMKLVSLFGSSGGDLSWRINAYRDGSGSWIEMVPCTSEEEARRVIADKLEALWTGYRARPQQVWTLSDGMDTADELGIAIPQDIRDALNAHIDETRQRAVAKAEAELAAALSKARGEA